jgi:hypothetical protein
LTEGDVPKCKTFGSRENKEIAYSHAWEELATISHLTSRYPEAARISRDSGKGAFSYAD